MRSKAGAAILQQDSKTARQEATMPTPTPTPPPTTAKLEQEIKRQRNYKTKSADFYVDIGGKDKSGSGWSVPVQLPADTLCVV